MKKLTKKQIALIVIMLIATALFIYIFCEFLKNLGPTFEYIEEVKKSGMDTTGAVGIFLFTVLFQFSNLFFYTIALCLSITIFKQEKAKLLPLPRTEDN